MRFVSIVLGARRMALLGALSIFALGASAASASAAETFGIKSFFAGTCAAGTETSCGVESEPSAFYTQAAGHPNYGITDFKLNANGSSGSEDPAGNVRNVRVDLPVGLSINPEALKQCKMTEFEADACPAETRIGTDDITIFAELTALKGLGLPVGEGYGNATLPGEVFNLVPTEGEHPGEGLPAEFGVNLFGLVHTILEGGVSWHKETGISGKEVATSGNYHEFFIIKEISDTLPILESRLIFEGQAGTGFLTLPSNCEGPQTTHLEVESYEGEFAESSFTTHYDKEGKEVPVEASGCAAATSSFKPKTSVTPSTTEADKPDGVTVDVKVPQSVEPEAVNASTLKDATVALPEGLTFNPAAASGLAACTSTEFGKGTANAVSCPASSQIGTVAIETPNLPAKSLTGNVYIGEPVAAATPASGNEYRMFIAAESKHGVDIRLEGSVEANEATGQLTTIVAENPPIPFSQFILELEDGSHTPLANPILCQAAASTSSFVPYSAPSSTVAGLFEGPFTVTGCAPFAPTQSTSSSPTQGGASTSFSFTLTRPEGQPYVSTLSATLPPGLVGKIPSVPRCEEAQASSETCAATSAIGTATVEVGSGTTPFGLTGTVYLTGPYEGAPYGLDIVTNAEKVGPYNYGLIDTRAKIEVNPSTAQVTVSSKLPTIVGGAPIRLRSLNVTVNHANFIINPTSCLALTTSSALTSTTGTSATASSPFQATGCSSLKFKPAFKAGSNAKTSRKAGASLKTTLTLPSGDANVKSVSVTLPKKLPSRESTLEQACLLATFEANPASCPKGSKVGTASVVTPVLPGTLKGTAYYVSLGRAGFPNLDIVLKGDRVTIVLVGQTNIKGSITHTKFLTLPDVPVKTFTLKLPMGESSALSANASLCNKPMYLPSTIVAQNGAKFTQKTRINVAECPIVVTKHRAKGKTVAITVRTPSAGRIVTSGTDLVRKSKTVGKAKVATITEPLSVAGARRLATKHSLKLTVNVKFTPKTGKASKASFKAKLKG